MAATRIPLAQGSDAWLEARRATIGSSDIPVIVGESTQKSAYTLAAEKLGLIPEILDDDARQLMAIGDLMQPVLIAIHRLKTGLPTKQQHGWLQHPQIPWATASLDGAAGRRAVEAKWSNAMKWRKDEPIPGDVRAQVQWQLLVTGWDVADVVVLAHWGEPRIETVERNDGFIDDLLYFAREFNGYLERGELPPLDGSESTARTLRARHPRDNGIWLDATTDLAALADQLADARARKRQAEADDKSISNALRAVIGDASGIAGLVALQKNRDSERVKWPQVASTYLSLLERCAGTAEFEAAMKEACLPDLSTVESRYTETAEGARPLRLLSKGSSE